MNCKTCNAPIAPGELHSCSGPSLHAPWLEDLLMKQNQELAAIRELLEKQAASTTVINNGVGRELPEAKTRPARRETRSAAPNPTEGPRQ